MLLLDVPSPTTVLAAILALIPFLFYLLCTSTRFQKTAHKKSLPPQVGGGWPVIGHLHLLASSQPTHTTLGNMADKNGPLFTIWLGVRRTLIVSSWEIAKECFTTNDKAFANRPKVLATEVMAYNYATFAFSRYGPYWRKVRKIVTLEFLSNHRLEMFKHVPEFEVSTCINEIYQLWAKNKEELVEMRSWFGDLTLNVVLRMVVGKRFARDATKEENEGNDRCRQALRDFMDLSGAFVVSDALPYLRWLDLGGYERVMKKTANELDWVLGGWLQEHKQRKLSDEAKGHSDFMDVMLSTITLDDETSNFDVDTIIKATCLAVILASTDATTVTLSWALSLLFNNPDTLKKAQKELDIQVGRERQVKESDLKNLIYLQAVLKETLRLYPPGPLAIPHESIEDCTLAGYHVPAGTQLLVNLTKIHRDPHVWVDPNEFRPERFLTTHKDVDVRGQHFELIPFGSGRRMCPGISFAQQVMPLTLATLLHAFEIRTPSDEPVDMSEKVGLVNLKATPLEIHLTPRLPAQAYACGAGTTRCST